MKARKLIIDVNYLDIVKSDLDFAGIENVEIMKSETFPEAASLIFECNDSELECIQWILSRRTKEIPEGSILLVVR